MLSMSRTEMEIHRFIFCVLICVSCYYEQLKQNWGMILYFFEMGDQLF